MRSAYDQSFTRVGDTDGGTNPFRAHRYTVDCGTPDNAEARETS
ncbi:MAG: hypothetical protein OXB92_07255 [Acidimicrobiaceae bacterium]|nr:hypothetical protein [Acidimicrobiaceae bacterium]